MMKVDNNVYIDDLRGELVKLLRQKIENEAGPNMRRHLVKVLKQKIDEKADLASTVKAAIAAMDDESLDNKADNEKDARIEPFLMYR